MNHAEILENYKKAKSKGAEFLPIDFGNGLPFKVDEVISVAPNPKSVGAINRATLDVKPGGRVYIAALIGEDTAENLARRLNITHNIEVFPQLGVSRYPSWFLSNRKAKILDFIVPGR